MSVTLSVVICTKNRFDDFKVTIKSLINQHRLPDELIVVDSSENVIISEYLGSIDVPFEYQYIHTAPGLTYQRNIGIKNCKNDLIFFFDDDVDLDSSYIELVEKVFEGDSSRLIGAVGGRISNFSNSGRTAFKSWLKKSVFRAIKYIFLQSDFGSGMFRLSGMPSFPHLLKTSRYIECLSGCCMAFRKEVFRSIKFDEKLSGYASMEDVDISKQVLISGYRIYYEASALVIHKVSSEDRLKVEQLTKMIVVNYAYLFQKNWRPQLLRKLAFYWTLFGLFLLYGHSSAGRHGVISGIKHIFIKQ